jgi:hypothetical protein
MATKEKLLNDKVLEMKRVGMQRSAEILANALASGNIVRVSTAGRVDSRGLKVAN